MTSLEAFENVEDAVSSLGDFVRERTIHYSKEDIEKAYVSLHLIENDLKVLEIIKKKEPSIFLIRETKDYYSYMDCEYGRYWNSKDSNVLKEEEYKIIKDWLERK